MEAESEFKVTIPFTETRTEHVLQQQLSKQFTVFAIRVQREGEKEWQVERRFSDFLTLHKTLKQKFPMVVQVFAATFPKKKLLMKTLDPRTVEERRAFFETYLKALVELSPRPGDVNAFLKIDQHPAQAGKKSSMEGKLGLDDFEVLETLGSGAFGKVLLVRLLGSDDELFAMKVLKKNEVIRRNQVEHTLTERAVMETISHPFIVPLRFSFQSKSRLFMVSEFCPGGELFYHLREARSFNENAVRFYASEVLMALEHLHSCQIVYRDLKPENVLLDREGHIRITDFGLSKTNVTYDRGAKTYCGTPEYLAPEMILVKREDLKSYGFAIDWWSLGTFCYELYVGHPPFQDRNVKIMTERILTERVRFPPSVGLPSLPFRDFVFALLTRDPAKRLGITQRVRDHIFFEGVDWEGQVLKRRCVPPVVPRFDPSEATMNFDPPSDEEAADSVAKLSVQPNANGNSQTSSPSKGGGSRFQRFVPLPTTTQNGKSADVNPSNGNKGGVPPTVAEEGEEEDELTAMFKSFAFERESNGGSGAALQVLSPTKAAAAAAAEDEEEVQARRVQPAATITEFQAVWGEDVT